jgi:predicted ATPase
MMRAQKAALTTRYGGDLDARSHGESFLALFQSRLVPGGLYLLDEPEAALSPMRQLALLSLMKQMVAQQCQFLIATHSPLLMAFPDAVLLHFEGSLIQERPYDEVEHVVLTRAFLADPAAFLHRL